jgi:hypothetical protein
VNRSSLSRNPEHLPQIFFEVSISEQLFLLPVKVFFAQIVSPLTLWLVASK